MHDSGLTPQKIGDSITFKEAQTTLLCKKLFMQPLDPERIPQDIYDTFYKNDAPHDMYIGEVIEIL